MTKAKAKAKPKQHQAKAKRKIGRNDPCWCGSGKKYKECHLPIHEAQRAEQHRLLEAQDTLMAKIMDVVQETNPLEFPTALEQFWKGKYTVEQMSDLDDIETSGADRFLTWFAFNYVQQDGHTLVEHLHTAATAGEFEVDEVEQQLLAHWTDVRMRPYVAEELTKGYGLRARDLLDGTIYNVKDSVAAKRLEQGEVMVGHLVYAGTKDAGQPPAWVQQGLPKPETDTEETPVPLYSIAGTVAHLSDDTPEKLVEFASLYLEDLRRTHEDATWNDLLRQRSHILNHFVMALPVEEYNPTLMDNIILEAQVMLQLTKQKIGDLMDKDDEKDAD